MRLTPSLRIPGLLLAGAVTLCAAGVHAEEAPPAPGATPAPAAGAIPNPAPEGTPPPPAAATPTAPVPAAEAAPAPAAEAAPAPAPAAEETFPAAWFRIDSDGGMLQLWAGATHMFTDTVGIASDMYVNSAYLGEFDLGPSFIAGPMVITPMLGLQADWANHRMNSFVPQLYITGGPDPIYMEFWFQNYENQIFDKATGLNTAYFRLFVDLKLGKYFGIGPEIEPLIALNDNAKAAAGDNTLMSLPIGANIMLSSYGRNNVLYVFGGYETQDTANDAHLAGRLTFVHNF